MTTSNQSINLMAGSAKISYNLHPVVVFSILDHYKRRTESQARVVGTLLGERIGDIVYIKTCFPVPHQENEDQVAVDMEYHSAMLALHTRVCPKEIVVGWYSTGSNISYISSLMHQVYTNEVQKTEKHDAVHLTVDVECKNTRMACEAYVGNVIKFNGKDCMAQFEPVKLDFHAYEAERIGVDALINGAPDDSKLDAPATILNDIENLDASLEKVLSLFDTASDYVDRVQNGDIKGDPDVGRAIAQALSAVPNISAQEFGKIFSDNIQDLLMIRYLADLTTGQLLLANKINGLLT